MTEAQATDLIALAWDLRELSAVLVFLGAYWAGWAFSTRVLGRQVLYSESYR